MERIDYYTELQEYSISQFRLIDDYLINLKAISNQFENLQDCIEYLLNTIMNIDNAEGVFLDYIGWLVGTSRDFFDISSYFKVNSADVNISKSIWFENSTFSSSSLTDARFRLKINAKKGTNISRCTRNENIAIIKNITFADNVHITNVSPMILDIDLIGSNMLITDKTRNDIEGILAPGVGIRYLKINGV